MVSSRRNAFSLIEMFIVVALMGVLAAVVLTSTNPTSYDQLHSTAEVIAADIAYARSLAVANGTKYRLAFDSSLNQYVLQHTGTNSAFDALPPNPLVPNSSAGTQQVVRLAELPRVGQAVQIFGVLTSGGGAQTVSDLEFGPLGQLTRTQDTVVWLACGTGAQARYLSVRVNAVSGLCWIENYQDAQPAVANASTPLPVGVDVNG